MCSSYLRSKRTENSSHNCANGMPRPKWFVWRAKRAQQRPVYGEKKRRENRHTEWDGANEWISVAAGSSRSLDCFNLHHRHFCSPSPISLALCVSVCVCESVRATCASVMSAFYFLLSCSAQVFGRRSSIFASQQRSGMISTKACRLPLSSPSPGQNHSMQHGATHFDVADTNFTSTNNKSGDIRMEMKFGEEWSAWRKFSVCRMEENAFADCWCYVSRTQCYNHAPVAVSNWVEIFIDLNKTMIGACEMQQQTFIDSFHFEIERVLIYTIPRVEGK